MKTIIVILGAARSGSTLLAKAIGGHSLCFTLGEINRFNFEINSSETLCGCGKKLNQCDFWIQTLGELNVEFGTSEIGDRNNFDVGIFKQITRIKKFYKLLPTVLFKKEYRNIEVDAEIENTFTLYKKIFDKTNASVLIDSTKGLFRALVLQSRKSKNIQFKFIQLTRDGRGVLNSALKTSYFVKHNDDVIREYKGRENKKSKKIINSWLYVNLRNYLVLKLLRKYDTFFVRYEDFTDNPEKYLRLIYTKVNLDYEKTALNLGSNINHILGGNASRINAKQINKRDDAWRRNLPSEILNEFNVRAGWFNNFMGYR